MIVMKFGGTSVESAEAIRRVAGIVAREVNRDPVVVVSAMGKTTNKLLAIASQAVSGKWQEARKDLDALRTFHLTEAQGLGADEKIESLFQELSALVDGLAILEELTPRATDAISAYGERLSSLIVAAHFTHCGLDTGHLDARDYMLRTAATRWPLLCLRKRMLACSN